MTIKLPIVLAVFILSANLAAAAESSAKAGISSTPRFKDPISGMEMTFVRGGCYQMGDTLGGGGPEEKPVHEVCVDDFYVGKFEVTQGQWKAIMGSNPSKQISCGENCPVDNVSWKDVQDFLSKLNSKSGGKKYRLPTEAEWEYAARSGGKNERYSGGNDADSVAWTIDNTEAKAHPVGTKAPNGLGIYDMSGNVWEWTNDWYSGTYYASSPRTNPAGPSTGDRRVLRGGSWGVGPFDARASYRNYLMPDYRSVVIGFRLLRTL